MHVCKVTPVTSNSATLLTAARLVPLSMGFSRQEYWSGLLCPPPKDLPSWGTDLVSLLSSALAGRFFTSSTTWEAHIYIYVCRNVSVSHSVVSESWWPLGASQLFCPWNFPSKNTGAGSHSLLQGIFPTQRSNPVFLHCRQILYRLIHTYMYWDQTESENTEFNFCFDRGPVWLLS